MGLMKRARLLAMPAWLLIATGAQAQQAVEQKVPQGDIVPGPGAQNRPGTPAAIDAGVAPPPPTLPFLASYRRWKSGLGEQGVDYSIGYTSEDLAAVAGGNRNRIAHAGQLAGVVRLDMAKLADLTGVKIVLGVSHRDGANVDQVDGLGLLLGPQEIYGRGEVTRVTQAWMGYTFAGGKAEVRAGRMTFGDEFHAFDCLFNNLSFCGSQPGNFVGDYWYNWPLAPWTVVGRVNVARDTYVKLGAQQLNPNVLKTDIIAALNPSGAVGTLIPFELGWTPGDPAQRSASIRVGGWYSTAPRKDVVLDIDRRSAALTGQPFLTHDGSYGGYVQLLRQWTRLRSDVPLSGLRSFVNLAMADRATSAVDRTIALGAIYTGAIASRPNDDFGLAIGFNHLNERLARQRAFQLSPNGADGSPGTTERPVEAYYSFHVDNVFMVRPSVQWVHRPGATDRRDVVIAGVRTNISL